MHFELFGIQRSQNAILGCITKVDVVLVAQELFGHTSQAELFVQFQFGNRVIRIAQELLHGSITLRIARLHLQVLVDHVFQVAACEVNVALEPTEVRPVVALDDVMVESVAP